MASCPTSPPTQCSTTFPVDITQVKVGILSDSVGRAESMVVELHELHVEPVLDGLCVLVAEGLDELEQVELKLLVIRLVKAEDSVFPDQGVRVPDGHEGMESVTTSSVL